MKKFLTVVMAVLFATTVTFAQATGGSPGKPTTSSGKKATSGKKGTKTRKGASGKKSTTGKKSAKVANAKGGKKGSTTPPPK